MLVCMLASWLDHLPAEAFAHSLLLHHFVSASTGYLHCVAHWHSTACRIACSWVAPVAEHCGVLTRLHLNTGVVATQRSTEVLVLLPQRTCACFAVYLS